MEGRDRGRRDDASPHRIGRIGQIRPVRQLELQLDARTAARRHDQRAGPRVGDRAACQRAATGAGIVGAITAVVLDGRCQVGRSR